MNTRSLEKFAQMARRQLQEQVASKLERVLKTDSAELRGKAQAIQTLQREIANSSRAAVVERVAYTWFNRFCALRYMDANHYTRIGAVSPAAGFTQPEILQEAKQGHIDEELPVNRETVLGLLNGRLPSRDPQQEAYRLLLVAVCNSYHATMPFLFERIDDYTELLMPDDLLSAGSILQAVRDALSDETCQDVEVIGWLYQFYIAEKKDEVFAALKRGQKIRAEDIPAASQLFTPHWIVRYMVENSLGRLWLLNRPHSTLAERMEFYIALEEAETDFLRVQSPEEIKLCDPAAGSGHILTYAFDLLYAIYEEEGYNPTDIARLILEKNLYGMEIDERAGALAAFALVMKARARDRRFFTRSVRPNICVLQKLELSDAELKGEAWVQESGSAKGALLHDLRLFNEADNFGSLLRPHLSAEQITALRWRMEAKHSGGQSNWLEQERREKIERALTQAEYLAQSYHVVVANPPYMGGNGMNDRLREFAKDYFPTTKSDLFAMFVERGLELVMARGYNAMVTMQSWMFLSSYEQFRHSLLSHVTIECMVHMANMVLGIAFGTAATVWHKHYRASFKGHFSYVSYEDLIEGNRPRIFPIQNERLARASAADFKKLPGSPIAYWTSDSLREVFLNEPPLGSLLDVRQGMATTDNNRFLRQWHETSLSVIGFGFTEAITAYQEGKRWFPYNKGGEFRKWYGNNNHIILYENDGEVLIELVRAKYPRVSDPEFVIKNRRYYFKPSITWSFVSSAYFGVRYSDPGFIFDVGGSSAFIDDQSMRYVFTGLLCSNLSALFLKSLNPTLNFQVENVQAIPVPIHKIETNKSAIASQSLRCITLARDDWDSYETSWDFTDFPLVRSQFRKAKLADSYTSLYAYMQQMTSRMHFLETENNRIFIDGFGLQDELSPEVPLSEITLTCNPHYRYGGNRSEAELEALLLADTMREFISYAVGCMLGRYSLDKPGLILANQGETLEDYLRQVPQPTYTPDRDNVIPILDGEWFPDDIVARFSRFLRVTFGEANYQENLAFIEKAIGRDLRSYFLRDFYDHHIKMYQKRPIYWLFSSPKGSFNALVYMHRYRPDTVSVVLNDYLREFRTKLTAHRMHLQQVTISAAAAQRDKTKALKEIAQIDQVLKELVEYENEVLYPLATQRVEIDLDDGVKVNYNKLGKALKRVTGLSE